MSKPFITTPIRKNSDRNKSVVVSCGFFNCIIQVLIYSTYISSQVLPRIAEVLLELFVDMPYGKENTSISRVFTMFPR